MSLMIDTVACTSWTSAKWVLSVVGGVASAGGLSFLSRQVDDSLRLGLDFGGKMTAFEVF